MASVVVDGVPYGPIGTGSDPVIGIGVTTRNRPDVLATSLKHIRKHTPGAKLVVVDDASDDPVAEATYRFDTNVGIARAKNKCLELLADCEHIFLFDDDVYPVVDDWWRPYVESPEPHLMWVFDKPKGETKRQVEILYKDSQHVAYHATRGAVLYVHRRVLDVVGGMDPGFGLWGWEHVSWSDRIHAAGLTTWRYADVANSAGLFHSMDEAREVESTVTAEAKAFSEGPGLELRFESRHSGHYIEYRELRDVVLTHLFTGQTDPQRNVRMKAHTSMLSALAKSVHAHGHRLVVLHDSLESPELPGTEFVQVETAINPYFQRHQASYQYLRAHTDIGRVWLVDGTDVEMLRDPFPEMEPGRLYVGSEPATLRNEWMIRNHPDTAIQDFLAAHPNRQLLNAGIIGGERETVMRFVHKLVKLWYDDHIDFIMGWETKRLGVGDMGAFQLVAAEFEDILSYGSHVNTVFKSNERNDHSWWKHK